MYPICKWQNVVGYTIYSVTYPHIYMFIIFMENCIPYIMDCIKNTILPTFAHPEKKYNKKTTTPNQQIVSDKTEVQINTTRYVATLRHSEKQTCKRNLPLMA